MGLRLRRLKRERDWIEREVQEMPESPLKHEKRELLRRLDELIRKLEADEDAIQSVVNEEYEKARREQAGRAKRDALLAVVTAMAALIGYSVNVPANAEDADLLHVASILHGLFLQQLVRDLLEHTPPSVEGPPHFWLQPLPDLVGSLAHWRDRSRPRPT